MNVIFSLVTFIMAFYCFVTGEAEYMKIFMTASVGFGFVSLLGAGFHAKTTTTVMERRETP